MRKIMMFVVSAFLIIGTAAFAENMKCGTGKCGDMMKEKFGKKCGDANRSMKKFMKNCDVNCSSMGKSSKCGASKNNNVKKEKKKSAKCGTGKCGGSK